jgi:hypothetical protein
MQELAGGHPLNLWPSLKKTLPVQMCLGQAFMCIFELLVTALVTCWLWQWLFVAVGLPRP